MTTHELAKAFLAAPNMVVEIVTEGGLYPVGIQAVQFDRGQCYLKPKTALRTVIGSQHAKEPRGEAAGAALDRPVGPMDREDL